VLAWYVEGTNILEEHTDIIFRAQETLPHYTESHPSFTFSATKNSLLTPPFIIFWTRQGSLISQPRSSQMRQTGVPTARSTTDISYLHICCRLCTCLNRDTGCNSCTLMGPRTGRRCKKKR
jgi:hypothetical protein